MERMEFKTQKREAFGYKKSGTHRVLYYVRDYHNIAGQLQVCSCKLLLNRITNDVPMAKKCWQDISLEGPWAVVY